MNTQLRRSGGVLAPYRQATRVRLSRPPWRVARAAAEGVTAPGLEPERIESISEFREEFGRA
jgi:hypothetical protein